MSTAPIPPLTASPRPIAWAGALAPLTVALPVVLAALTGLYDLAAESLWIDEASSVWMATRPWPVFWSLLAGDPHPPLYYLTLKLWISVVGPSEWAVRVPSVIASVLAVFLLFRFLTRVANVRLALLASLTLALSGLHVHYAQEARPYAFLAWLAVAATDALWRWQAEGGRRHVLAYTLCAIALAYTHVGGLFVLIGQGAWWLWMRRASAWRQLWLPVVLAVAYAPRWPALLSTAGWACSYCQPPSVSAVLGTGLTSLGSFMALVVAFTFVILFLYVVVRKRATPPTLAPGALSLLVAVAVAVQLVPLTISLRGSSIYLDRVTLGGLFALLTLIALAFLCLPRPLTAIALGALWVSQLLGLIFNYYRPVIHEDWRTAVSNVAAGLPDGGVAFVYPPNYLPGAQVYAGDSPVVWQPLREATQLHLDGQPRTWIVWAEGVAFNQAALTAALPPDLHIAEVVQLTGLHVIEIRAGE
jgi:hypothetical protein